MQGPNTLPSPTSFLWPCRTQLRQDLVLVRTNLQGTGCTKFSENGFMEEVSRIFQLHPYLSSGEPKRAET